MATPATCHSCVYAYWDPGLWMRSLWSGFPARPICANQPGAPGVMKECGPGGACRNYRPRPPTPTGENVKRIPLTGGFYAYVDAADYEWLSQWRWRVYAGGYAARQEKGRVIYMHREIMKPPKGKVVDHINGNGFDNTRANLRNVTRRENMANARKRVGTMSIYKGVTPVQSQRRWHARVHFMDKAILLGKFDDEREAARAYDHTAVEVFGELARLNFPGEWPAERRARVHAGAREKREALIAKAAQAKRRNGKGRRKKDPRAAAGKKRRTGRRRRSAIRTRSAMTTRG